MRKKTFRENICARVTSDPEGVVENVFCKNCSIILDANKTALLYHQYSLEHEKSLELSKKKLSEKREFKKSETKKSCLEENYIEKSIQEENISKVEEDVEKVEKSMTEELEPIEVIEIS